MDCPRPSAIHPPFSPMLVSHWLKLSLGRCAFTTGASGSGSASPSLLDSSTPASGSVSPAALPDSAASVATGLSTGLGRSDAPTSTATCSTSVSSIFPMPASSIDLIADRSQGATATTSNPTETASIAKSCGKMFLRMISATQLTLIVIPVHGLHLSHANSRFPHFIPSPFVFQQSMLGLV